MDNRLWCSMILPRKMRSTLFGLTVLCSPVLATLAATSYPELQQGIASYNAADHSRAVSYLHAHLSKNQNDALAHYYLANSLLKLGQTEKAIAEYRKAYDLSKDQTMKQYCLQAMEQVSPIGISQNRDAARAGATTQNSDITKQNTEVSRQNSDVAQSLERIKRQSELAKDNKIRNGDADAKDKLTRGVHDVQQLQMERDMKIRNLLQPDAISITGNPIYLDHTAEIEQIKRDYENRIKEAQLLAKQEANYKKEEVARDANKMISDVDNLRSQLMDTRHLRGTPALQAVGTNYYNRQYGDPRSAAVKKSEPYVDELMATPEKMLLEPHTTGGGSRYRIVREPSAAEQDKLKNHSPGTALKVKGTLIRK
ncbi:MAG: hypothetical protein U0103_29355 [Candidatus Obscuribacterales bacterium]